VQRELLLDTVVQNTPVALVLTDSGGRVAYANIAARHLFNEGAALQGLDFAKLCWPTRPRRCATRWKAARTPCAQRRDGRQRGDLPSVATRLPPAGPAASSAAVRRMTRELSRQEVATWKRVIRVISHELNNSLAPISSLAHSGAELARRGDTRRAPGVFATIGERARTCTASSPATRASPSCRRRNRAVDWAPFLEGLAAALHVPPGGGAAEHEAGSMPRRSSRC
jgi:two-component system nitrogen regulation sensor histidine kinase NtrY